MRSGHSGKNRTTSSRPFASTSKESRDSHVVQLSRHTDSRPSSRSRSVGVIAIMSGWKWSARSSTFPVVQVRFRAWTVAQTSASAGVMGVGHQSVSCEPVNGRATAITTPSKSAK